MKKLSLWAEMRAFWQPRHAPPLDAAEPLVITDALQVRRILGELVRLQNPVALQAADGRFIGGGVLAVDGQHGVRVQLRSSAGVRPEDVPWPLNATASGSRGLVMFTLHARSPGTPLLLCAAWPDQLIHVQSRRHFRLTALSGRRRRVWLSRPGSADRLPVHDLSEEGVGLEVFAGHWPELGQPGRALLHLDDEVIQVPLVEVVHSRPGKQGGLGIVGARMLGLGEEQLRLLRRWIVCRQAAQCAGPGSEG